MRALTVIFLLTMLAPWSQATAQIDPEEILRQLPPPEVNYTLPEIKAIKPPVTLPDNSTVEYYGRPRPSTRELEESIDQIKSIVDTPAVNSTIELIKNLSDDDKPGREKPAQTANTENTDAAAARQSQIAATSQQPDTNVDKPTPPPVIKPPPVIPLAAIPASPKYPPPTGNLMAAWQTLRQNPEVVEFAASLARDRQLAEDAFDIALQMSAEAPEEAGETSDEVTEETAPAGSHDAVLATAMGLYKKQDWKGLKNLFNENPEAGATKDGLRYIIESEINEAKPNYLQIRRNSDQLIALDENDAMANYGMALYFYNARKPDTTKAGAHLAKALKAKNPPEGASAFYWKMTFKKFMIPLLLVIAGLIGGISHVIKKKKAAASIDLDTPAAQAKPEQTTKAQGKLMQKLAPLLEKFKGIFARFKKKPAASTPAKAAAADVPGEVAETSAEQSAEEEAEEASAADEAEEEEEEEEETTEEAELEAEDEEALEEEEEEEEESA